MERKPAYSTTLLFLFFLSLCPFFGQAQRFPTQAENIEYLVTFGKAGDTAWGDDDFSQTFFFVVPQSYTSPVYIRVFDPEAVGSLDEINGVFDTQTRFSVYGGPSAHTGKEAKNTQPGGGYDSGTLLSEMVFDQKNTETDQNWFVFGPFNPKEGELDPGAGGYVFKVIADGISGDDGNLYYYFLSTVADENKPIDGSNAFTYEYSFRVSTKYGNVAHIYPYIAKDVVSVTQHNFDFDSDGEICLYTVSKNRHAVKSSGDNHWAESIHTVTSDEANTSYDFQIIKKGGSHNDFVIYITNQFNKPVPFYSIPIGGKPKFNRSVQVKSANNH